MSRVRVHNLSISLDGFATGEGQAADAPFGHAGHRLHEWMLATRFWELLGLLATDAAGTVGVDNAFAERNEHGTSAEIMGAGKFDPPGWQDAPEWRGWWGDNPPFHTPTYVLTHHARPPAGDGGRYDVPLPRRRAGRRTRRRSGGRRRPGRPYRGWPDDAPRVSRRRAG